MNLAARSQNVKRSHVQLPDGRRLYLQNAGLPRTSADMPLVVLAHGLGGTWREWNAVFNLVARFAPVCLWERAGYQGSDLAKPPRTPEANTADLHDLLQAAGLPPSYLLVGHSYGGVLASHFLRDYPDTVSGMVLIDSPPVVRRVPDGWINLMGALTYEKVIGLEDIIGIDHGEYTAILRETTYNERAGGIAGEELEHLAPSNTHLRDHLQNAGPLLGDRPLNVIFCDESNDFHKIYDHGVKHDHGTWQDRETLRKHLETMSEIDEAAQRAQLALSRNARFVKTDGMRATHNVHLVDPQWVADQIKWAFEQALKFGSG